MNPFVCFDTLILLYNLNLFIATGWAKFIQPLRNCLPWKENFMLEAKVSLEHFLKVLTHPGIDPHLQPSHPTQTQLLAVCACEFRDKHLATCRVSL